jgi:hypothetical protein
MFQYWPNNNQATVHFLNSVMVGHFLRSIWRWRAAGIEADGGDNKWRHG